MLLSPPVLLLADLKVFNRGFGPSFLVRLVSAVVREVMMLSSRDSVFFDSPLSNTGIQQVRSFSCYMWTC